MSSKFSSLKDAVKTGCRRHMQMFQIFSKSSRSFISPSVFLFIGLLVYFVSLLSLLAAGYRRSFIGRTAGRAPWQKTENKRGFATERRSLLIGFVQSFVGLPSHGTRSFTSASRIQPGRDGIRCFGLIRFAIATTTDRLKTRQTKSKSVFIVPLPPVHRY